MARRHRSRYARYSGDAGHSASEARHPGDSGCSRHAKCTCCTAA